MSGIFFCGSRRVKWCRELPPPSQETAPQLKALVYGEVRNGGVVVLELVWKHTLSQTITKKSGLTRYPCFLFLLKGRSCTVLPAERFFFFFVFCVRFSGAGCACQRFASEIEQEYGRCDVLVNNAGIAFKGSDPTPFK